ncbi:HNH endonuclease signature motif containing protein [Actinoplanes sp. TFC3]|uniref:HNH endonuclease signature motif containing protein n=1 Tax=Actinoplanes sp. TFC3 TaxID=1710355 RepID=UPI00082AB00A|nr:HNH endonuclease signature motif containing protein [Actinoplanes sp. TFC3]
MFAMLQQIQEDFAKAAEAPLWSLRDDELISCLEEIHRCEQVQALLTMRLTRQIAALGIPAAHGHRTTTSWLRSRLQIDPCPARTLAKRSERLSHWPAVEKALLHGHVDVRQADVIAAAVDQIPETLKGIEYEGTSTARIADDAERTLIGMAAGFPAHQLRRLGARILDHVAPELADRADELALQREEERSRARRGLSLSMPVEGLVRVRGALSKEDAEVVSTALQSLSKPHPGDDRTAEQRRADALVEVCDRTMRAGDLPIHGGEPPQLAVTVSYDLLTSSLGAAFLGAGSLSAASRGLGSGTLGAGSLGAASRGAGSLGSGSLGAGSLSAGSLGAASLGSGSLGSGSLGAGSLSAGSLGIGSLGIGTLDSGERLSAGAVRRLACDARIVPVILGSKSEVLDVGRLSRTAPGPLRRALVARDGGCAFPGCDRPPRWTDAHHILFWALGGLTELDNLVLLCRHHHNVIHDEKSGWEVRLSADRHPEFLPPAWLDPERIPQRNKFRPLRFREPANSCA